MTIVLALAPIALLFGLLIGARWTAMSAGAAAAVLTSALAVIGFSYGAAASDWIGPLLEAAFLTGSIVWIVFGALCIYEIQQGGGAIKIVSAWLAGFGDNRAITALLIAWFFALFLEGAAGFGTPVALAAPLLVGLGFAPAHALKLALIGHSAGVAFGALGTPVVPLLAAAPMPATTLSATIAALQMVLGWTLAVLVYRSASSRAGSGWSVPLAAAAMFFLPALVLAAWVGPELPTLAGALIGFLGFALFNRRKSLPGHAGETSRLASAMMPYLTIIVLVLATRLLPPLTHWLGAVRLDWDYGGNFSGSLNPIIHPGTLLFLSFVMTAAIRRGGAGQAAFRAARRLPPVIAGLFAVLALSRLMVHSGMTEQLAMASAGIFGNAFLLISPAVGALGSFMVGSATGSNVLFAEFQVAAAGAVNLPLNLALAGQAAGSAIGNIIAPHNIVAGAATVGLLGSEGRILRRTLPVCLLYSAAGGILLFGVSLVTP